MLCVVPHFADHDLRHSPADDVFVVSYTLLLCRLFPVKYLDKEFTLWDRFELNTEMTIGQFIDYFKVCL